MLIKDKIDSLLKGELFLKMYKDNELIFSEHRKNLIVNNSKTIVAGLLASKFTTYDISQIGFGDGTTVAISSDSDLSGDYTRKVTINTSNNIVFGSDIAQIHWSISYDTDISGQTFGGVIGGTWTPGDPFTIKEFGLFSTGNDMFNRIVWSGADLVMDEGIKLEGYFAITVSTI